VHTSDIGFMRNNPPTCFGHSSGHHQGGEKR